MLYHFDKVFLRIIALSAMAVFFIFGAEAQIVQKGVILEYNFTSHKTPIAGVEIKITGAGSTVSKADGSFELNLLTAKAGDLIRNITFQKEGYLIFNKNAVSQWNINPHKPFTIVLCRSDRYKESVERYMQISSASYAKQNNINNKKIYDDKSKAQLRENVLTQKIEALEQFEKRELSQQSEVANFFAQIDIDELSDFERECMGLILSGNIGKAISKYEKKDVLSKYKRAVRGKDIQQENVLFQTIQRQRKLYALAGGLENEEKSSSLLKEIFTIAPTNNELLFLYAKQTYRQGNFAESFSLCKSLLDRPNVKDSSMLIDAYDILGGLSAIKGQRDSALIYYSKGLNTYKTIANKNDDISCAHASIMIDMAHVLYQNNDFSEAEGLLNSAKQLLDVRGNKHPKEQDIQADISISTELSYIYHDQDLTKKALDEKAHAESMAEKLFLLYKNDHNYSVWAEMQASYGKYLIWLNETEEAEKWIQKAKQKYIVLRDHCPFLVRPRLGELYRSLGSLYMVKKEYAKSNAYYDSILIVNKSFMDTASDAFLHMKGSIFQDKSRAYFEESNYTSAWPYLDSAITCYHVLYEQDSDFYGVDYSNLLLYKAAFSMSLKNISTDSIIGLFDQSFAIMETLDKKYPGVYTTSMIQNYLTKGMAISNISYQKTLEYFNRAIKLSDERYQKSSGALKLQYIKERKLIASLFNMLQAYDLAASCLKKTESVAKYLIDKDSAQYVSEYCDYFFEMGKAYVGIGKWEKAKECLKQPINYYEQILEQSPTPDNRSLLASALQQMGVAYVNLQQYDSALTSYYKSKSHYLTLRMGMIAYEKEYLDVLYGLAITLYYLKRYVEAKEIVSQAIKILPDNKNLMELLSEINKMKQ